MPDLKSLIGYIIDQVTDKGGVVGRTSLVKLVYLADVEHCKRFGKQATALKWRFHHYGPYAAELDPAINPFGNQLEENDFTWTAGERKATGYRYTTRGNWREIELAFNANFGSPVKRSVDKVIDRWGLEPLNTILDYVYFETEPMEDAQRGEYLDFSKVQKDSAAPRPAETLNFSGDFLSDLRQRLKERKETSTREVRKATEPVYDPIYDAALRVMGEEERPGPYLQSHVRLSGPGLE